MNSNLERIRKEAIVALFKKLSRNLPGGPEEKYNPSGHPVSGLRF
jgi:hypothetical protein